MASLAGCEMRSEPLSEPEVFLACRADAAGPEGYLRPQRAVGHGMLSGEPGGCSFCNCACAAADDCDFACTSGVCLSLPPAGLTVGPDYPRCQTDADCGGTPDSGMNRCLFEMGCVSPIGLCTATPTYNLCPARAERADLPSEHSYYDDSTFCGCDGLTYRGTCPVVPYSHSGPC